MRVAIVTESFLPQVDGVSNTVRHVVEQLVGLGHEPLVVCPGPGPDHHRGVPVVRLRSTALPRYRSFALGLPDATLQHALARFRPDVVHLASPVVVGAWGLRAARQLGVPTVAVYQTDVGAFARQYGVRADAVVDRWLARLHRAADRTLVPSTTSRDRLAAAGVTGTHLWGRGVSELFGPGRHDPERHAVLSHGGRDVLVGYVGRLAAEKQVRRLAEVAGIPGTRLVVVGEGPERDWLGRRLAGAHFTGRLEGSHLATAFATLDVFVHPGTAETFCQTVQEAQASGVPVVAPAAGGPLDLVDHGRTGLLFDPDDRPALWRAVTALARDEGLRGRLADAARTEVAGRTWERVVSDLLVHYEAVVDGRRRVVA